MDYVEHKHSHKAEGEGSKKKWLVEVEPPVSFFVQFSDDILNPKNHDLLDIGIQGKGARRMVVVDHNVYALYGKRIEEYFRANDVDAFILPVESHEEKKDLDTLLTILAGMEKFKLHRAGEPVIAIGGGVLLDIVGVAATLYRRGVPYIRVPTTLLGLVDASVGVKTGINHFGMRNRLGSYYGPVGAYLDRSFLGTVSRKEISNGCGEILKMAVIKDATLFNLLEMHGKKLLDEKFQKSPEALEIIDRSIQGMVEELAPNLWEKDMKRLVNFGHSFSGLIEMNSLASEHVELSHGEAVALDVLFSCILSERRGFMKSEEAQRVGQVMRDLELPTFHTLFGHLPTLEDALADTVRHRDGAQELPIPLSIGRGVFFNDMTRDEIQAASDVMQKRHET